MKRVLSVILSVFLMTGMFGCQQRSSSPAQQNDQQDIYLTRSEQTSVYGVEAPDSDDDTAFATTLQQTVSMDGQTDTGEAAEAVIPSMPNTAQSGTLTGTQAAGGDVGQIQQQANVPADETQTQARASKTAAETVRGVWISYLTLEPMAKGKTKDQFISNIDATFSNVSKAGFNTVFVQVRPFGDALYRSDYFPWSRYLTGTEGQDPGYDPLTIMCALADQYGLRIEAWINPYRVRLGDQPMSDDNQAKKWLSAGSDAVIKWNGGIYYNPGNAKARELIINGVKEIVANYDVDGIHFDDYFYPTADLSFDQSTYQASGTAKSQADWRRENVNTLVRDVYAAIKAINQDCVFGISPQGNVSINYNTQFADVATWLSNPGYVDYICPQLYYGYENDTCPYAETVEQWNNMIKVDGIKLYVGIAAYKIGELDQWAGAGKEEWIGTTDLLGQMVKTARKASHYGGVVFYSYESLFLTNTRQMKTELENLEKLFA